MAKRICYVHVGTGKTGTSAIQYALTKARDYLLSCGLHYPDVSRNFKRVLNWEPTGGNASIIHRILRKKGGEHAILLLRPFSDRPENLILSCEGLSNLPLARLRELVHGLDLLGYEIRCLVFFRPQVEMVVSRYLQMVKANKTSGNTLDDYVEQMLSRGKFETTWSWYARAQKIDKAFGDKNVTVKWYPSVTRRESSGVVNATLDWMGVALPNGVLATHDKIINPTPGREALVVLERLNSLGLGSKDFSDIFLIEAHRQGLLGSKVMLSPSRLQGVESATRDSNVKLFEHYFPGLSVENELGPSVNRQQMDAIDENKIEKLTKIASRISCGSGAWLQRTDARGESDAAERDSEGQCGGAG